MLTGKEKASDAIKINKRIMMGILKKRHQYSAKNKWML